MKKGMTVKPIAADSLGVRSMATAVKTKELKLAIDPDAALGPSRYGLPPHDRELEALASAREDAHRAAAESDAIVLSHYHFDHFSIGGGHFRGKTLYVKSKEAINKSQLQRKQEFEAKVAGYAEIIEADGCSFSYGKTRVEFSPAVPHGPPGTRLGYVIMTLVDNGFRFIHSSDVQGPIADESADWIIERTPDLLYLDGPPLMFLGWKLSVADFRSAIANFQRILDNTEAIIICDHHLLRSLNYARKFPFFDNPRVMTAAEYLSRENLMLEARRKELYESPMEK